MKFELTNKKLNQIRADLEVILIPNKKLKHKWIKDLAAIRTQDYKASPDEILYLPHRKRLYVGIESLNINEFRIGAALAIRAIKSKKIKSLKVGLYGDDPVGSGVALVEGFILGAYEFDQYRKEKSKNNISRIILATETHKGTSVDLVELKHKVQQSQVIAQATNYVRDLVNQGPSDLTPPILAKEAKRLAKENNLKCQVYGKRWLAKQGMGAFLAVNRASSFPPQLIHLHYQPSKPKSRIVLVGKGITYDTGGLSLKPRGALVNMKIDMGGAAAILGIIQAVSQLKLPIELHTILGVTENAIGQHAYKPDDVLTAMNSKTIEVKDTDAEGRLVLADCLVYAQTLKPDYLIDIATLTGASVVGLGEYTMGLMGHNQDLKRAFLGASVTSGEEVAELPFNRYLKSKLKSEVADLSNLGPNKLGDAIVAALFLSEFIDKRNKDKWVHLDIAGPAFVEKPWGYNPYGASGAGVRLVVQWMEQLLK